MQEKFNQKEYIKEYNRSHYASLRVQLKKEEKEQLDKLLKKHNLPQPAFMRWAMEQLKQK